MRLVVVDTNVWVSAFLNRNGFPARIKDALETAIVAGAECLISRDDDLKGDSDLIAQMRAHGVEVITVSHFLKRLESESH